MCRVSLCLCLICFAGCEPEVEPVIVAGVEASAPIEQTHAYVYVPQDREVMHRLRVAIGEQLFFDETLSNPAGTSCATCHQPELAFADGQALSFGATGKLTERHTPSLMYVAYVPPLETYFDWPNDTLIVEGGLFYDGRVNSLEAQALFPLLHPNEMNLTNEAELAQRLRKGGAADMLTQLLGEDASDAQWVYAAQYALAQFQRSKVFAPFDSRFDAWLKGEGELTTEELRGLNVFVNEANCALCHPTAPVANGYALFSDFGYDNLGLPADVSDADEGLFFTTGYAEDMGKFRSPTLRNVAVTAPYMHDGSMATLDEVLEFYNTRDVTDSRFAASHYPDTVNREDMGDLQLTDQQLADLKAFLHTLTDRQFLAPGH